MLVDQYYCRWIGVGNDEKVLYCLLSLLQNLTILNLHENKIKELPDGIGELVNLTTLDLSHNHLESLPEGESVLLVTAD